MPKNLGQYNNDLSVPRKKDIDDLANVVDGKYSASNPPPYPVTSVNSKTGDVTLTASDVGAAPSGYGLGTRFVAANMIADANAATVIGWYRVGSGTANYNKSYGDMLVDAIAINQMLQTVYQAEGNILQRRCISGTWDDDWAYVNPPLALNTEYRTVEWYQGNPVYVKLISYTTASPDAGTYINVPHGITNLNHIVRYTGYSKNYPIPYFASSGAYTALQSLSSTNLVFANVGNTGWGTSTWYITLYYTKSA